MEKNRYNNKDDDLIESLQYLFKHSHIMLVLRAYIHLLQFLKKILNSLISIKLSSFEFNIIHKLSVAIVVSPSCCE